MSDVDWNVYAPKGEDVVNHPSHYTNGGIECLDYIRSTLTQEEYIGYLRGNMWKYLHRWRHKNGKEDLKKAQFYLTELLTDLERER